MKDNKQASELDQLRQDYQQQQFQSYQPFSQQAPLDQLKQKLATLEQDIRKQLLETETELQGAFSQSTTGLAAAQATRQLQQIVSSLTQVVQSQGLQGSTEQYQQLLGELENSLRQQLQDGSQQVMGSLLQGITALAQASTTLLDSSGYQQMLQLVGETKLILANWEAGNTTGVH